MLGYFSNFPRAVHQRMTFTHAASNKVLQQKLAETLCELNKKTLDLEEVTCPTIPKCVVNFEVGIAEEENFNFIDQTEMQKIIATTSKTSLKQMDFFWAIQYHINLEEERKPLKFDYYFMRLAFSERLLEIEVAHERGPRYVSPEDMANFVAKSINQAYQKKILKPVQSS